MSSQPEFETDLYAFDPLVSEWFSDALRLRHRTAVIGLARNSRRPRRADLGAHRLRQNAGRISDFASTGWSARPRTGELPNETEVVYVSPLKALSNDIRKNLEIPLTEIARAGRQAAASS